MRLHARLEEDCHQLGSTDLGILLLHRNASLPWFILVPDTDVTALYQMPEDERIAIEQQWNLLAAWVHKRYDCVRVNMAAIGNLVPQLHLHVVGRKPGDPCWPGVVWGQPLPEAQWKAQELSALQEELQAQCALVLPRA